MKNLTQENISFLYNIDKKFKYHKEYYFEMFRIDLDLINEFISSLDNNQVYLTNPIISINCKYEDPFLTLSRQFLITNQSNPVLIYNYLLNQFKIVNIDFDISDDYYFLIFNYRKIELI